MSNPSLSIEETAALMAHIAFFGGEHLSEILLRKAVETDDWDASSEHWNGRLVEAAGTQDLELLQTFGGTFKEIKQRLEAEEIRLQDIGPLPSEVDDTAADLEVVVDEGPSGVSADDALPMVSPPEPGAAPAPIAAPTPTSPSPAASSPWARSAPQPIVLAPSPSPDVTADAVPAISAELPFEAAGPRPCARGLGRGGGGPSPRRRDVLRRRRRG